MYVGTSVGISTHITAQLSIYIHARARTYMYTYLPMHPLNKKLKTSMHLSKMHTPHLDFDRFSFDGCLRQMGILPTTPEYATPEKRC